MLGPAAQEKKSGLSFIESDMSEEQGAASNGFGGKKILEALTSVIVWRRGKESSSCLKDWKNATG